MRAGALLNWTEAWSPAGISRLVALHLRGMSARATTKHLLVQGARPASGSEGGAGQGAQRRKQEAQHALGVFQTETLPFTRCGRERRSSSRIPQPHNAGGKCAAPRPEKAAAPPAPRAGAARRMEQRSWSGQRRSAVRRRRTRGEGRGPAGVGAHRGPPCRPHRSASRAPSF